MIIKEVKAKSILDSRRIPTIQIIVKVGKKKFITSAPSGKSTGIYEKKSYAKNLEGDIKFINNLDLYKLNCLEILTFNDLVKLENFIKTKLGANSLFALEASILKALANELNLPLWKFLGGTRFPHLVGNAVGGGLHARGRYGQKPDFQEFLFIPGAKSVKECVKINKIAHSLAGKLLKSKARDDEGAWETNKTNRQVLDIMDEVKDIIKKRYNQRIEIGLDVAASSFFKNNQYNYKNTRKKINSKRQIRYLSKLIERYNIFYLEDGLNEKDFKGFAELLKNNKTKALIVGDDLTTTNPKRFQKAIKNKSINAIIVKPNQIGSLIQMKQVIEIAKKHNIKTIISHRAGETMDNTIADLAVGWGCDFIKTGIYGNVRESKLNRLIEIEKRLKRK